MRKLAVITSFFPVLEQPFRGHSAYQTLRELRNDFEIEVFCPLARYPSHLKPTNFLYLKTDLSYSPQDLKATYIEYSAVPVLSRPVNPASCVRAVLPKIRSFQPDLILNYFLYPEGCAAIHVGSRLKIPVVLGARGSDLNRIPDWITENYTKWALRQASYVITVSNQLRDKAISLGANPNRTRAVPNGCDNSVFHPSDQAAARLQLGLPEQAKIILFVGWLTAEKGVREMLTALATVQARHPSARLICVGEGALRSELETRARVAGILDKVFFAGQCTATLVARYLAAADLLCLPSYAEGCPNAVIEALACGVPVVATDVGGIPDLVDDRRGILVPPRNPAALAQAIVSALDRGWDKHHIANKFQDGWRTTAKQTLDCLQSCLQ